MAKVPRRLGGHDPDDPNYPSRISPTQKEPQTPYTPTQTPAAQPTPQTTPTGQTEGQGPTTKPAGNNSPTTTTKTVNAPLSGLLGPGGSLWTTLGNVVNDTVDTVVDAGKTAAEQDPEFAAMLKEAAETGNVPDLDDTPFVAKEPKNPNAGAHTQEYIDAWREKADTALDAATNPAAYEGKYDQQLAELMDKILGRKEFSYDMNSDPAYQAYKKAYTNAAQQSMLMANQQARANNGGFGSSTAQMAAQAAYAQQMNGLTNAIPELQQNAYNRYYNDALLGYKDFETVQGADWNDYLKYTDQRDYDLTAAKAMDNAYRTRAADAENAWTNEYEMAEKRRLEEKEDAEKRRAELANAGWTALNSGLDLTNEQIEAMNMSPDQIKGLQARWAQADAQERLAMLQEMGADLDVDTLVATGIFKDAKSAQAYIDKLAKEKQDLLDKDRKAELVDAANVAIKNGLMPNAEQLAALALDESQVRSIVDKVQQGDLKAAVYEMLDLGVEVPWDMYADAGIMDADTAMKFVNKQREQKRITEAYERLNNDLQLGITPDMDTLLNTKLFDKKTAQEWLDKMKTSEGKAEAQQLVDTLLNLDQIPDAATLVATGWFNEKSAQTFISELTRQKQMQQELADMQMTSQRESMHAAAYESILSGLKTNLPPEEAIRQLEVSGYDHETAKMIYDYALYMYQMLGGFSGYAGVSSGGGGGGGGGGSGSTPTVNYEPQIAQAQTDEKLAIVGDAVLEFMENVDKIRNPSYYRTGSPSSAGKGAGASYAGGGGHRVAQTK